MVDYKLIVTIRQFRLFSCVVARLAISLQQRKIEENKQVKIP